jgi:hypothetical protein
MDLGIAGGGRGRGSRETADDTFAADQEGASPGCFPQRHCQCHQAPMGENHIVDTLAEIVQAVPGPHIECCQMRAENRKFPRRKLRKKPILIVGLRIGLVRVPLRVRALLMHFVDLIPNWHGHPSLPAGPPDRVQSHYQALVAASVP